MFLKSLTLKGFKSFADPITLDLEPGINVVVGPNGSGKSNVVDAVAWVLGAQGPRTMRSSKMEDVIFAGTTSRSALGRAEVSLTIDNSDGALAVGFAEITITRTLFRSGDSEYAVNGVPCRLLDVQELMSDTGVGRQQHVIVSQGQLDAILNARPEERRMVIEEAAGVLKYRKRREKAQRRLEATEADVLRLQDLMREVRRGLRPLERQAADARRHGGLVTELAALRRYLGGRELAGLRHAAGAGARERAELESAEQALTAELAGLDAEVAAAEAMLTALATPSVEDGGLPAGEVDLADALVGHEGLRERARGLLALVAERRRGVTRDLAALADTGTLAGLEAEVARLAEQLAGIGSEVEALEAGRQALADAERDLEAERAAFGRHWPAGAVDAPPTGAAEVRAELAALRASSGRGGEELDRLRARLTTIEDRAERLAAEGRRLASVLDDAAGTEEEVAAEVEAAAARAAGAAADHAGAEAEARSLQGEWHTWSGRAQALAQALDEARARAGAERLAGVEGVLGTLVEMVEVDDGWQAAFEAAAGEAIAAVLVDGQDGARRALSDLQERGLSGAVLPVPVAGAHPGAGPAAVTPGFPPPSSWPVRPHVRAASREVESLLDRLLAAAVAVDGPWEAALELAAARPDLVVVTPAGHRFAASAWRTGGAGTGATGAALEDSRRRCRLLEERLAGAGRRLDAARAELEEARGVHAVLLRSSERRRSRVAATSEALRRVRADQEELAGEESALRTELARLGERVSGERRRMAELGRALPELEALERSAAERSGAMERARRRIEEKEAAVTSTRTGLEVRAAGLQERRGFLLRRQADAQDRLASERDRREAAERRRVVLEREGAVTERLAAFVADRLRLVEGELAELREHRRRQAERTRAVVERLEELRGRRADRERRLTELRDRRRQADLAGAELRLRTESLADALRRDMEVDPEAAVALECPPLPGGATARGRAAELERELRLMGPVNPLALEEHAALQERLTFLEGQLEDVRASRRELAKVIRAVDAEIVDVFASAYADVAEHFTALFSTLFPGGAGRLRLTAPDNLLDTGVEVEARPSGKNVRQLSLLSGGERSLTALAFLFAVFRSRPSPFYLMDEVEAALDDINLHRFLELLAEFRREAQLVIVTHQRRTMEAADCLYGVTMQPGGSSRVVSQKVAAGA